MMGNRSRFHSTWNSVATIMFFLGILGIRTAVLGFPLVGLSILMWIIGGSVATIFYGPKDSNPSISGASSPRINDDTVIAVSSPTTAKHSKTTIHSCPSCGAKVVFNSNFCEECGTHLEMPVK